MNWDRIDGDWGRFKAIIKVYWAGITDAQLDRVAGQRDRLVDVIQAAYGMSREQAEEQLSGWRASRQRESEAAD